MSPADSNSHYMYIGTIAVLVFSVLQSVDIDPVGSSLNVLNAIVPFVPEDIMTVPIPYDELADLS